MEVLVALAIVATTFIACMKAMGVMAQSGSEAKLRLLAQLSAQNQLATLRALRVFPPVGITDENCPQGKVALVCRREIKTTPNPTFRRVEVRVHAPGTPEFALARLTGVVSAEP